MTKFTAGQEVIATATAQGMSRFAKYIVIEVKEHETAFGNFVTYVLLDEIESRCFGVSNGHLLLVDAGQVSS
jgi:hypothetical protein